MTRAKERALEAYPPETRKAFELLPKDWNKPLRTAYVKGYEQAEKNLGWHPASEHPPVDEEVIVLTDTLGVAPYYEIAVGHIIKEANIWNFRGVKYWMPMPKIPEK